ncbi:MAG TPA: class I SAM-dependent methyltransferase [Clostridiales bacterium]|nr:class I SAM-dependent methyltransferase [Clostridiales bacterium]
MMDMKTTRLLQQAYDNHAQERDLKERNEVLPAWKSEIRRNFLQWVRSQRGYSILDLGAGTGRDCLYFKEQRMQVTAIDFSEKMVQLCRKKGIEAHAIDFQFLHLLRRQFDSIWAMNSLLHLAKSEMPGVLKGIRGLLKPGGLFYLGMYGGVDQEEVWEDDPYTPKRFFSFYSDDHLRKLLEIEFDIIRFERIDTGGNFDLQSILMEKRIGNEGGKG